MRGRLALLLSGLCLAVASPVLADGAPTAAERNAIAACLKGAKEPQSCVGTVQGPCIAAPGGGTTIGMKECTGREIAVWDERLNAAYKAVLAGRLAGSTTSGRSGADILRQAQRSWIAYRDQKCLAATLPMDGGTGAGLLSTGCYLDETARQAIWLGGLGEE